MCVHRLGGPDASVHALAVGFAEIAGQHLAVIALGVVVHFLFQRAEDADGGVEALFIARGTEVLGQTIDGIGLRVGLLDVAVGSAIGINGPEHAAIALVDEVVDIVLLHAVGHRLVVAVAIQAIGGGEGPEHSCAHDGTLGCRGVPTTLAGNFAVEPAVGVRSMV